ncbi:unnamed protein product [Mytilus coruscus]|uniref:CCHC-type domain-containing protein n=1 Tax=Mytilus coruscus TaxID=42192 RepID=A0A6J8A211_MYTCO|nr:unnamed protein product [Mytilus coruscus]
MNAEVEALCRKMTQDRLKRIIEGLQGTDTFTLQNEVTVSPDVNNDKMATYADAVSDLHKNKSNIQSDQSYTENNTHYKIQREQSDPSDFVKPIFLKDQDVHGSVKPPRAQWLTNVEISRLNLRGRQVPLHSKNPHNPSTLQSDTIRIKVKNIPPLCGRWANTSSPILQGCEIQGLFRERLRIDGKVTNYETGDRQGLARHLIKPIPRNLPIGKYIGRIFHSGQPEFENRNNNSEERICYKCLQPGHMLFQCPNDWACKICKESGHKMIDCQKHFQDKDENNQQLEQNGNESGDDNVQEESVELTKTPTKSPPSKNF